MRIHTYLQGGAFDGQLVTLLAPEAKGEIRVAMSDDTDFSCGDVTVEVYSLIDVQQMPGMGSSHLQAGYRWVGSRKSAPSLVEYWIDV